MLRRNYRRTRSDETDVRSATGEELTGAMAATSAAATTASGVASDGGNDGRRQSGRDRTSLATNAAASNRSGGAAAGNGTLAAGSRSAGDEDDYDDDDDDDFGGADSVDDSPRTGHHHRQRDRHRNHRSVTTTESCRGTPFRHNPSVGSADTEISSLDTRELWLPDTEPTPSTMSALHQFGAEMLRLSRGLEKVASPESKPTSPDKSRSVVLHYYYYYFKSFVFWSEKTLYPRVDVHGDLDPGKVFVYCRKEIYLPIHLKY